MNAARLPQTDSIQELASFWDTHDVSEFEDELEEVRERVFERDTEITVHLETDDANAVRTIAKSRGVGGAELIREWVSRRSMRRRPFAGTSVQIGGQRDAGEFIDGRLACGLRVVPVVARRLSGKLDLSPVSFYTYSRRQNAHRPTTNNVPDTQSKTNCATSPEMGRNRAGSRPPAGPSPRSFPASNTRHCV